MYWLARPAALLLILPFAALAVLTPDIATAGAAGLALAGAVLTLAHTDATARRSRTAEYRARWEHPELLSARIAATKFLSLVGTTEDDRWNEWNEWLDKGLETETRLQVMAILNFWEEVASAFNQDFLDNAWFYRDLAWQLDHNWERAGWFIRKFRSEHRNAAYFCEWQVAVESVSDDLERQKRDGRRRACEAGPDDDLLTVPQCPPGKP